MTEITALPGRTAAPTTTTVAAASKSPRVDLYLFIHKALRQFMSQTLTSLGALDVTEVEQRTTVLDRVDTLLAAMRSHLHHENDFVHTAIEARRPGGARHTADDHLLHQEAIGNLEDESRAVRDALDEHRPMLAQRLYRHLAEFIGENLVHMHVEETRNNAELWALYSDEELLVIQDRLLASIPPDEMMQVACWMAAALSVPELVMVFADMRQKAPPPAFEALLGVAQTQLDQRRWAQLAHALGQAPVPGLMTA